MVSALLETPMPLDLQGPVNSIQLQKSVLTNLG